MSRTVLHVGAVALITLAHVAIVSFWQPSLDTFPIDDPYIHLVYGANLAAGGGFAFNRGEPSMGTSSPLWTVVVAAVTSLASKVVGAMSLLGSAFLLASALALHALLFRELVRAGRRESVAVTTGVLGALVLLSSGNAQWISLSGMETSLFLAVALLVVVLYVVSARPTWIALAASATVLTRLSGLYLIAAIVVERVATRRSADWRSLWPLAVPLAALAAFGAYSWQAVGSFLPTTVGGKKATYVQGDFDLEQAGRFVVDYFSFLSHEPVYFGLMVVLLGYGAASLYRAAHALQRGTAVRFETIDLLAVWGLVHLGVFAFSFRSLLHYGRYFVVLMPPAVAVGALVAHRAADRFGSGRLRFAPAGLLGVLCVANLADLPSWRTLYRNDIRHIRETYVTSAEWVRDHTPKDAIIAAYDIGALKYYSGRTVVDLFGLLDERVHPLLRKRDVASYLRDSKADYVLYLQSPNSEHHTRVYLAEYGRDSLLDQHFLAAFRSKPYPQPTVTQSFEIEAFQVRAWHPVSAAGRRKQFIVEPRALDAIDSVGAQFGSGLQLVGIALDTERNANSYVLRRVLRVPTLGFRLTLYWRILGTQRRMPEVEISFVDATERVWYSMRHAIAHGRVDGLVSPGEVVRQPHFVWIPPEVPDGLFDLRVRAYPRGAAQPYGVGPTADTEVNIANFRILAPEHVGL